MDFVASKGLVHFAPRQKSADMLPAASEPSATSDNNRELVISLTLVLEPFDQAQKESVLLARST